MKSSGKGSAQNPTDGLLTDLVEDLLTCVHCGLCLPSCPTYRVLGDENDSPRGRLYLLRAQLEGREGGTGARRMHLGRCLGCRACETVCPAGVPYGALLERGRAGLLQSRPVAARWGRLVLWTLTGRGISRILYAMLRIFRDIGAARGVGRALPGRAGLAARLLAATRPRASTLQPATAPEAPPTGSRTYALIEGCVMRGLFAHVHRATRGALADRGLTERPARRQGCCGALHAHAGYLPQAREMAKRNIGAFEAGGADYVVADAAGCGAALREYGDWFADDPEWAEAAARFSDRVRDVMELAAEHAGTQPRSLTASTLETDPHSHAPRIAYDAPCHLLHAQGVDSAPLGAVREGTGLDLEPLPSSSDCCGGAGLYNLFHSELSARILDRKVEEIRAGHYDAVATGNPGCIMQIGAGLDAAGLKIPVVHPIELLHGSSGR